MFQQRSQKSAFIETHWKRIHRFQQSPLFSNDKIAGKFVKKDDDDNDAASAADQQHHLIHKFKLKKFKNLIFTKKMANTLSVMTNVLRNAVSKKRIRYNKNGFNLDLAYICDNIIAMGYPADNLESIYRNRLEDVYKFLEENHQDHYKIYNLCLERSYDKNKFHGRVSVYPFEDHNPPTIELIQKFCKDVHDWLNADPLNVAAVHCKAGKGRTGTMICCYLVYSGLYSTAEEALSYYDLKRTKDRKGVTIPSQRRYVQYFSKLHRSNKTYEKCSLQLCEIRFTEANALHNQGTVHCSISVLQDTMCGAVKVETLHNICIDFRKSFVVDLKHIDLEVAGDIKIELNSKTSRKKIFHFWVNTYFIKNDATGKSDNEHIIYTLYKNEIDDAHKDKEHKCYPEDFKIELVFVESKSPKHTNCTNSTVNRISNTNNQNTSSFAMHTGRRHLNNLNSYVQTQSTTQNSGEIKYHCDHGSSSSSASVCSLLGGIAVNSGITGLNTQISGNELNNTITTTTTSDRLKRNSNGNATNTNADMKLQHPLSLPAATTATATANKLRLSSGGSLLTRDVGPETLTDYSYATTPATNIVMAKLKEQIQQQQYQPSENNVAIVPPSKVSRGSNHTSKINELNTTTGYGKTTSNIHLSNNLTKNGISSNHHHHWKDDNNEHDSYELDGDDNDVGEDWESGESSVKPFSQLTTNTPTTTKTTTKSFAHNQNSPTHQQSLIHLSIASTSSSIIPDNILTTFTKQTTDNQTTPITTTTTIHDKNYTTNSSNLHKLNMMGYPSMNLDDNEITNISLNNSRRSSYFSKAQIGGDNNNGNDSSVSASSPTTSYASFKNVVNDIANGNDNNDDVVADDNNVDDDDEKSKQNLTQNSDDLKKVQTTTATILNTKSNVNNEATCFTVNNTPPSSVSRNKFFSFTLNKGTQNAAINSTRTTSSSNSSSSSIAVTSMVSPPPKQPFFRRKSFKSLANNNTNADVKKADASTASAIVETSGSNTGLANLSKQKLKIKLKKNRFKLAQKFQKLQNYLRSDPDEFCENFVQQTIVLRRNSNCSINSRNHKTIVTATATATPPPPTKLSASPDFKTFNCVKRNDNEGQLLPPPPLATTEPTSLEHLIEDIDGTLHHHMLPATAMHSSSSLSPSVTASNASLGSSSGCCDASCSGVGVGVCSSRNNVIAGSCDDYYSSICDNQLSFNNSPCKSPRSLIDIELMSGGGGGVAAAASSLGSPTNQLRLNQHHHFHHHTNQTHHHHNHHHYHLHQQQHHQQQQHQQQNYQRLLSADLQQAKFQKQLPQQSKQTDIVVVAAKPAKTHAIGFNVKSPLVIKTIDCVDHVDDNNTETLQMESSVIGFQSGSDNGGDTPNSLPNENERSSVYFTPPIGLITTAEKEIFIFADQNATENFSVVETPFTFSEMSTELINTEKKEPSAKTTPKRRENFNLMLKLKDNDAPKVQFNKSKTPSTDEASFESIDHGNSSTSGTTGTSSSGFSNSDCFCCNDSNNTDTGPGAGTGHGGSGVGGGGSDDVVSGVCNCNPFTLDLERFTNNAQKALMQSLSEIADEAAVVEKTTTIATTNRSKNISKTE